MEHIDHTSARVTLSALLGLVGGSGYATLTGLPLRSTSIKVAGSFAIAGTALFSMERIAFLAFEQSLGGEEQHRRLLLTSHAFSGVAGGALNGYLYQRKPIQGMVLFVPIMMGTALLELSFQRRKLERSRLLEEKNRTDETNQEKQ